MKTVMLKYEDYRELLGYYAKVETLESDLKYIISKAEYDTFHDDLQFIANDLKRLCEKCFRNEYNCRLKELKQEKIKEDDNR